MRIVVQTDDLWRKKIPSASKMRAWGRAVLGHEKNTNKEICIRVVDEIESAALNERFRQKKGPTNVLSFTYPSEGDVVLCAPKALQEAMEQHKSKEAHFAHLIVHGILHVIGYDHNTDAQASTMETKEIAILDSLGIRNPYSAKKKT